MIPVLQSFGLWLWAHLVGIAAAFGIGSGGIGVLTYIKHMPAPLTRNVQRGALFDTIQDLAKNPERIKERLDSSTSFAQVTKADGTGASAQSVTEGKT